ncbi:MAG: carboxylating nicotinate-nucleotide diphosphorylase [Acidobacteriota bacterium]
MSPSRSKTPTEPTGTARISAADARCASAALAEDVGAGDLTTAIVIEPDVLGRARVETRQDIVLAGTGVARATFQAVDPRVSCEILAADGAHLSSGSSILRVTGPCRAILTAERTALNFLQRLSGIATLASRAAACVAGTGVTLLDTRKTTPGLRRLEKAAVRAGGVCNHRNGLDDAVLIKDNHLACCESAASAVVKARMKAPGGIPIEVEIDSLDDLEAVIGAGADIVLLDNFTPAALRLAVQATRGRVLLEASGGITLERLAEYASTGVDRISLGFLTHSAPAVDLSLVLAASKIDHAR